MPRRRVIAKREILPDPKFNNQVVAKFINHVMVSGKKAVAESIVYGALNRVQERDNADPIEVFEKALDAMLCRSLKPPPSTRFLGEENPGSADIIPSLISWTNT